MLEKLSCLIFIVIMFLCGKSKLLLLPESATSALPRDIMPLNYNLDIFAPFSDSSAFRGKVSITVQCKKITNQIILHQQGLQINRNIQIKKLPVVTNQSSIIHVQDRKYDWKSEWYTIKLEKSLEKDINYEIEIEFSGHFSQRHDGLFSIVYGGGLSRYNIQSSGRIVYAWMNKFGARRIFPCFDELGMKATFAIRIGRPSTMQGFSNAIFQVTETASFPKSWFVDVFEKTLPMEASAVAIVVADSHFSTETLSVQASNAEIRIFAPSSVLQRFIGAITLDIFQFFSNYFKVSYALKKLDVFVLPEFRSRAKSSFGVISLSLTRALAASENRSSVVGYEIVSELCYVINQQWMGYAVTMSNLRDNYLHNALNLFLQTVCVHQISSSINPKWEAMYMDPDIINSFYSALESPRYDFFSPVLLIGTDETYASNFTHKELAEAYHLIRMIYIILGQNIFEKSITNYLKEFEFGNSSANDLWNVFTNTAMEIRPDLLSERNLNVGDIVGSWIDQKGLPLITIRRDDKTKQINISQRLFYAFDDIKPEDKEDSCWIIPLKYTTKSKSKSSNIPISQWSTCKEPLVIDIDVPQEDWVLFDLDVMGRINYDESNWNLIQKDLVSESDLTVFDALTRARLTSDMFALAEVGELSYKIVLDAMKYLSREVCFEIFQLALFEFDRIYLRLIGTSISKSFRKYVREVLDPVFNREEFNNLTEYHRAKNMNFKSRIIESSCRYGVKACIKQSLDIINAWRNRKGELPAIPMAVRDTIHCQAIKFGNQKHWDFMFDLSKQFEGEKKREILRALTCSINAKTLKRFLNWSIRDKLVSLEDALCIFHSLAENTKGYGIMKRFFMSNYDRIYAMCKNDAAFALYWYSLLDATVDKKDLRELEDLAFSKEVSIMSPTALLYKSHENAKKNVAWFERSKKAFDEYFGLGIFNLRFSF